MKTKVTTKDKQMKNRNLRPAQPHGTVIGIALLAAALTLVTLGCGHSDKKEGEAARLPAVRASVVRAEAVEIPQRLELSGTVEADRTAAVSSRVMASVTSVLVKAGDTVKAGQVLLEIDPQTARGQEAQAKGALAQAKAGLVLAEKNYERFKALQKGGSASDLELDMARMQYEQAKGAVEQGSGAVEAASSVARESRVVAPFDGRVSARLVEAGDLAAPGRPLMMVESGEGRRLTVAVPESIVAASGLAAGKTLPIRIDAFPGRTDLTGKVVEMSPGADPASHTFTVKLEISGARVPSGVAGRTFVDSGKRKAVLIPDSAVLSQGGLQLVVIKDAAGKARSRAVTVGPDAGQGQREILSGLAGGEEVLVGLGSVPADGSPVEVATATPEARK